MRAVVNSEKKKRTNDMSRPSKLWFDSWDKVLRIRTSKGVAKAHVAFMKKHKGETKGVWSVNKAAMDNPYCMALAFCLSEIVKAAEDL